MTITERQLRAMEWTQVFEDRSTPVHIQVFRSTTHAQIAVIHEKEAGKKLKITYNVHGQKTDSPSRAIKIYNDEEKARQSGRRILAGSVEQIREKRAKGQGG